jgi:hypothetical protein
VGVIPLLWRWKLETGAALEHRGEILGVREQHCPGVADPVMKADAAFGSKAQRTVSTLRVPAVRWYNVA